MRVLTVGNFYPPHHFGGYEQVWGSAAEHLRARGHDVRVLATTYRHPGTPDGDEPDVHRALRWYWRDRKFDSPSGQATINADIATFIQRGPLGHVLTRERILRGA